MSKRSNFAEFDKETRKYIKKRDKDKCVICGAKGGLQIMHIFLSRAKGGKGCKENGCLGCVKCHNILDNYIGKKQKEKSREYLDYCKKYLIEKENIKDTKELIENLKYKKEITPFEIKIEKINRCKNCVYLIKKKGYNTSVSNYYCKYRKLSLSKNTRSCKNFKNYQID